MPARYRGGNNEAYAAIASSAAAAEPLIGQGAAPIAATGALSVGAMPADHKRCMAGHEDRAAEPRLAATGGVFTAAIANPWRGHA